ncbi:Sulfatase [Methyloligella halotolerans]|uniref:Sulfatase n=1 Tax=Methyloligella halotolerans TaxID=1177755 RepID=A0A1E2S2X4_9HYPH|nr:sulfatase-like hydrolase/transferase [Methyloligella halotolerans]ODA68679.1 Sulfatase [Methyloligella halotolerans]
MWGSRSAVFVSALALAASLFLLMPSPLFQQAPEGIDLAFGNFYLIGALVSLAVALPLIGLGLLVPRLSRVYVVLALAIAIKALLFASDVPVLDGDAEFTPFLTMSGIWSLLALLLALGIAAVAVYRFGVGGGLVLVVVLALTLQPLLNERNWSFEPEAFETEGDPPTEFMTFSKQNENILIVLVDTFSSDVFAEVMEENDGLREAMQGFTYFYNTLTYSPYTMMSMMTIYSGRPYEGGTIRDYYAKARDDSMFADFEAKGGRTQLAGFKLAGLCPAQKCWSETQVASFSPATDSAVTYAELLEIGALRVLPTFAHEWMYNGGKGHIRGYIDARLQGRAALSAEAMASFADSLTAGDVPPTLKFFHLMTTHSPLVLDDDCDVVSERDHARENYKAQLVCAVRGFTELLDAMKRAGVYDNTTIVLLGDHGGSVTKSEDKRFFDVVSSASGPLGRLTPVLAIKPKDDEEPFTLSGVPARLPDLRATLCAIAIGCDGKAPGENIFALQPDPDRKRDFIDYDNGSVSRYVGKHGQPEEGSFVEYTFGGTLDSVRKAYDRSRVTGKNAAGDDGDTGDD